MYKLQLVSVLAIWVGVGLLFSGTGWGQNSQQTDLEQQITEMRRQIDELREKERQQILEQLGDRYKTLMDFSVEELRYAIDIKLREKYDGASILSAEDEPEYLGKLADPLDPDSIFNTVGRFGSELGMKSIWNSIGRYGGTISMYSPFNSISTKAPLIVKNNQVIGRLTISRLIPGGVDPALLRMCFTW